MEKINLSKIPRCNQVWEDMTPNEKGRICQKCTKTIIDFTKLSNKKIAEIHMFSMEPVCGLYTEKQLLAPAKLQVEKTPLKWASLYMGISGLLFSNALAGQVEPDTVKIVQTESKYVKYSDVEALSKSQKSIPKKTVALSGVLKDESGEVIIGGNVYLKGTTTGVVTDYDGSFFLDISSVYNSSEDLVLIFSYLGYGTLELNIDKKEYALKEDKTFEVTLTESLHLTEFVITTRRPLHKRIWYKIKNIFRRK